MADLLAITKAKRDESRDLPDEGGNRYVCYVIEPATFYPAMTEHILEAIDAEDIPEELRDVVETPGIDPWAAARALYERAKGCDFQDVLVPLAHLEKEDPRRLRREHALEICRLWFTRWMKQRVKKDFDGAGLFLKILEDDDYRL